MDPTYLNVVDTEGLVWTLVAYLIHGGTVFVQVGLAGFLLATGIRSVASPAGPGVFWRRLGAVADGRSLGAARIAFGLLLFAPLALGAPMVVSLAATLAASALLWRAGQRLPGDERSAGRWARGSVLGLAAVAAIFMVWEREDGLALAADVLLPAIEWRQEELSWQLETDSRAPKVGDLAPDFELQDPEGVTRVRLSDFRGKRPVALVFGSYT
ncbi:MAG: hypothetical protein JRG76_14485 [Deltaproteobacteria bacterium]|nr:hypothetical protein [Deltaproteobacteria bacterium]MBW2415710.1 hypothetical protein [Deltaproteobacteria bacterium]